MHPPIVCFTCGFPLGKYHKAFNHLVAEKHKKILDDRVDGASLNPANYKYIHDLQIPLGEELNVLGIQKQCCRTRMITYVSIDSLY